MNFEEYIKMIKEHCMSKFDDYVNERIYHPLYKDKEYFQGRADSYTEILGFIIGSEFMVTLYQKCLRIEKKRGKKNDNTNECI